MIFAWNIISFALKVTKKNYNFDNFLFVLGKNENKKKQWNLIAIIFK